MKDQSYILNPRRSVSDNDRKDDESVLNIGNLLVRQKALSKIVSHDKQSNIDGYIELLDDQGIITGKITVQVKTYNPNSHKDGIYPIPEYIVGYASRMVNELVMLIVSDYDGSRFFWKLIDTDYIRMFAKSGRKSKVYRFKDDELAYKDNIAGTISRWQGLFASKMATFSDEHEEASRFIESCKLPFQTIVQHFHNLPSSHIEREETKIIKKWLSSPLGDGEKPIKILSGSAGCGKTVIIKDILDYLDSTGQAYLAIKADQAGITDCEKIISTLSVLSADYSKCIFIVDQLDALSRYLSNDREKLNNILSVIAAICNNESSSTRVLVSCREFDLRNDSRISRILSSDPIKMNGLSLEDIHNTLEYLEPGLYEKTSQSLRALLSTPQFLDIFCRIYSQCDDPLSISNNIGLYDALWEEIIHPVLPFRNEEIEAILFDLAKAVVNSETLNPVKVFSGKRVNVVEYLKSQGIIIPNGDRLSFFHQTFFEYVYARLLVTGEKSIKSLVLKRHQGLFIRNMVKQILDYLKGKDFTRYTKEIESLLSSEKIRTHLKTLVLESLAFSENVSLAEQDLIRYLFINDRRLFNYFLKKTWSAGWFDPVMKILSEAMADLNANSPDYFPIILFMSRFCEQRTKEVFAAIGAIKDCKTKEKAVNYLLRADCDYTNKTVLGLFRKFDEAGLLYDKYTCLKSAAKSNLSFVIKELSAMIGSSLNDYTYNKDRQTDNHEILHLCKDLGHKYPEEICSAILDCIIEFACTNHFESYRYGLDLAPFDKFLYPESNINLLYFLRDLLKDRDLPFQKRAVSKLLRCKEDYTTATALELMSAYAGSYLDEIKSLLEDRPNVSRIIQSSESKYWFMMLLQNWQLAVDDDSKLWFHEYVLSYTSPLDKLSNKERHSGRPTLYPYWGEEQWMLLHTVPQMAMSPGIKRKMQELDRRFGGVPKYQKPSRNATMASYCSRLVPAEICMNFTEARWKTFIHKSFNYKESRRNGEWKPVDERLNIEDFAEYIAANPETHIGFVHDLILDKSVDKRFKYAGVKGLAKGGTDPERVLELIDMFSEKDKADYEYHAIEDLLIKNDSPIIDRMIREFADSIVSFEYEPKGFSFGSEQKAMKQLNDIVNHIINTRSGQALDSLIDISHLESRRKDVYRALIELRDKMHPEMQVFTVWRLYSKEYYDETLFADLLREYLSNPLPAFLLLSRQCLFNHHIDHPDIVDGYLDAMLKHPECSGVLAQIHFLSYSRDFLRNRAIKDLDFLLSQKEDDCYSDLAKICIVNTDDEDYRDFAYSLLERMIADDSESHSAAKTLYRDCDELAVEDFPEFYKLLMKTEPGTTRDGHSVLSYLEKCISVYPRECYLCLKHIDTYNPGNRVDEESYIILLLKLYAVLKENADRSTMESIMDVFDRHIILDNYGFRQALEEIDKEQ